MESAVLQDSLSEQRPLFGLQGIEPKTKSAHTSLDYARELDLYLKILLAYQFYKYMKKRTKNCFLTVSRSQVLVTISARFSTFQNFCQNSNKQRNDVYLSG